MTSVSYTLSDITIRTDLKPGDLGYVIYRHGKLYDEEYHYGITFETYVALGMHEFYRNYNSEKDRVWICEHKETIIGFVLLMHRENNAAQLRYFYIEPEYRGIGLGKKLMDLYMNFLKENGYQSSYLWTTHELYSAASLYKRHGFTLTEEKRSTAFGKELIEQRYDLQLAGDFRSNKSPRSL
jgi:peptidyl-dipeptidase Dcp